MAIEKKEGESNYWRGPRIRIGQDSTGKSSPKSLFHPPPHILSTTNFILFFRMTIGRASWQSRTSYPNGLVVWHAIGTESYSAMVLLGWVAVPPRITRMGCRPSVCLFVRAAGPPCGWHSRNGGRGQTGDRPVHPRLRTNRVDEAIGRVYPGT